MPTNDSFDRQFRRRARSLRRRPAPRSWERVEARLDRRDRGPRFLGIRPWMIAAVLLLVAGVATLVNLPRQDGGPLAQRAQHMEELDTPLAPVSERIRDYTPLSDGRADGYLRAPGERTGRLTVAPKYRL